MKKYTKNILITTLSLSTLAGCYYFYNNTINYSIKDTINDKENKNSSGIKKVNYEQKENSVVVVEITGDGYVIMHDDHTHIEKGIIPYNSKFLYSTVYKNLDYTLKNEEILYEVAQGYIVKIDGKFYYYPKKNITQTNIVNIDEAKTISKNNSYSEKNKDGVAGVTHATSDGFLLTSESQIVGATQSGIIANHNGHSHLLMYADLYGTKWEYLIQKNKNKSVLINHGGEENIKDNYIFNTSDIVAEDNFGYTVHHGDHYHYIYKQKNINNNFIKPKTDYIPKIEKLEFNNKTNYAGIDYTTSDGFLFDGKNIETYTDKMLLVNHNGHLHPVFYSQLINTKWQSLIPKEYVEKTKENYKKNSSDNNINNKLEKNIIDKEKNNNKKDEITTPKYSKKIQDKINSLAKKLNIAPDLITLISTTKGDALLYPHDDHTHTVLIDSSFTEDSETKEELDKKIKYISEIYGVPEHAIEIIDDFFKFNDPGHEFDPSHIHPYIIPKNKLIIPEITGDSEIDFEAELLALSERTGIPTSKIKIKNNKFVIDHGNHEHFVNIKNIDGIKLYFDNKLPEIVGEYIKGQLDKEIINEKIDNLILETKKIYKANKKEERRIIRELETLKYDLKNYASNSTIGYEKILTSFANKYIYKTEKITTEKNSELITKYNETEKLIRHTNQVIFEQFSLNKDNLIYSLQQNSKNIQKINYINHLVTEINKFDRNSPYTMIYAEYFLQNVDSEKINNQLREEISSLILEINKNFFNTKEINKIIPKIIDTKLRLAQALNSNETNTQEGEKYLALKNNKEILTNLEDLIKFSKDREEKISLPENITEINNIEDYIAINNITTQEEKNDKKIEKEIPQKNIDENKKENTKNNDYTTLINNLITSIENNLSKIKTDEKQYILETINEAKEDLKYDDADKESLYQTLQEINENMKILIQKDVDMK